jgi:hypothetical protein
MALEVGADFADTLDDRAAIVGVDCQPDQCRFPIR